MNDLNGPFLYTGGSHTGPLEMRWSHYYATGDHPRPYILPLGGTPLLSMNAEYAERLLVSIVEALYGQNEMTMATAELLVNRGNAVLVDKETRRCACACGCDYKLDGYAPSEDICGACLDNCEPIKCPSCNGSGQTGAPWDPDTCGTCRGEGTVMARDLMTRDEYEALMADTQTEEG